MKTVVLISGQARTFRHCWKNQYWMVLRKLIAPHFFCCVAGDADGRDMELLCERFANVHIRLIPQPEPQLPEPDQRLCFHAPFSVVGGVQGLVKQLWGLNETWKFFSESAGEFNPLDTMFIRLRPDLWFQRCDLPAWYQSGFFDRRECAFTPWWRSCGGVNDRFSLMDWKPSEAWFTTYSRLDSLLALGCPLHQESLIAASLEQAGCSVSETLSANFSFVRRNGNDLQMVQEPFEPMELARFLSKS
jgi:hypothetical protein